MPFRYILSLILLLAFSGASAQSRIITLEKPPRFKGGDEALDYLLTRNIRYPATAEKEGIGGVVIVQFIVDSSGQVWDISVPNGLHQDLDAEAIRVIALTDGKWEPGIQDGKPVAVQFGLPVRFTPSNFGIRVAETVDLMPVHPNGDEGVSFLVYRYTRYPKSAVKENIRGTVIVQFSVSATGQVSDYAIKKGLREDFDKEALRVVRKLGSWVPAQYRGQRVPVTVTMPVYFSPPRKPDRTKNVQEDSRYDPVYY
ncbi:energy transducer TonB [Chitinophaga barathri]|uniref:Energy transducer TonB n=1 Tax=Chitinophaga barathri TaxID=1647451 RepID=A0A3N4MEI9_9BACT|nr:energy transducer TonB [Chitinophaga barathri]RPD42211.1 energy transducer TonB [Chitinophaga barathri]